MHELIATDSLQTVLDIEHAERIRSARTHRLAAAAPASGRRGLTRRLFRSPLDSG